jgi:hypothetical protein
MNSVGFRKAAIFLATLPTAEQNKLLANFSNTVSEKVKLLIEQVQNFNCNNPETLHSLLDDNEVQPNLDSKISMNAYYELSKSLSDDWLARVLVANSIENTNFVFSLMDSSHVIRLRNEMKKVPDLPVKLKEAILIEAANLDTSKQ